MVELFEARSPKGKAVLARTGGVVRLAENEGRGQSVTVVGDDRDSEFLPGERVDQKVFRDTNMMLRNENRKPAEGRTKLMGITRASLATDSWLSAASF